MVRLWADKITRAVVDYLYFNSTMVRLWAFRLLITNHPIGIFQFHYGSIMGKSLKDVINYIKKDFNSTMVRLWDFKLQRTFNDRLLFQFHYGSIMGL